MNLAAAAPASAPGVPSANAAVAPGTAAAASPATTPATTPVTAPAITGGSVSDPNNFTGWGSYNIQSPAHLLALQELGLTEAQAQSQYGNENALEGQGYLVSGIGQFDAQQGGDTPGEAFLHNYAPQMTMDAFMAARGQPNYDEPWLNPGWSTPSVLPGGRLTGAAATPTNAIAPGGRAVDAAALASDQANAGAYGAYQNLWGQQRQSALDEYMNSSAPALWYQQRQSAQDAYMNSLASSSSGGANP
jgi:hypothetical protein